MSEVNPSQEIINLKGGVVVLVNDPPQGVIEDWLRKEVDRIVSLIEVETAGEGVVQQGFEIFRREISKTNTKRYKSIIIL